MNDMYNKIAQALVPYLPEGWEHVVMYAHVKPDVYEIYFYVMVDNKYVNCFAMEQDYGITRKEVMACFDEIYEILYPDYEDKEWYSATVRLTNEGDLVMYYDYDDHTEDEIEYREAWKEKYLQA